MSVAEKPSPTTASNEVQTSRTMTSEDYHANRDAVSATTLKQFIACREAYYAMYEARTHQPEESCDKYLFGAAIHTVALEGVENTIIEIPEDKLAKNGAKSGNGWKEFNQECRERRLTPLKTNEYATLKQIVKKLKEHPRSRELLYGDDAVVEQSIFWVDKETQLRCRCRPDVRRCLAYFRQGVDLKGMADTSAEGFANSIVKCGYDIQSCLYRWGMEAATGEQHGFTFVVVGKEWPHLVCCYELSDEFEKLAERKTRLALERLAECRATGNWNSPGWDTIQAIEPPYRAKNPNQWEYA